MEQSEPEVCRNIDTAEASATRGERSLDPARGPEELA